MPSKTEKNHFLKGIIRSLTKKKSSSTKKYLRKSSSSSSSSSQNSSILNLKKISTTFFTSKLKENKYYRINVSIECFYYIDNILNKIDVDLKTKSANTILNLIVDEILKSQSQQYSMIKGGANMRKILYNIVKCFIYLGCYGFILIAFIQGTQRCSETKTVQSLTSNAYRYYSKSTKCQRTELPYFSTYLNYLLQNTKIFSKIEKHIVDPQKYALEEIYSITLCDEYNHVGKDDALYCKDKDDSIYCSLVQNTPTSIVSTIKTIDAYLKPATYFSTKNYETDIKTILNDVDICTNNMITPIFWALSSREILERKALYLTSLYGILYYIKPKAKTV